MSRNAFFKKPVSLDKFSTMQTFSIEMGKKPFEIARLFEQKGISRGDKIVIAPGKDSSVEMLLAYLLTVALSLAYVFKKKDNGEAETASQAMDYDQLVQLETPEAVEVAIEENFGVEVELPESDDNPIDSLFGIWKDTDITIEKIREEAWGRNW